MALNSLQEQNCLLRHAQSQGLPQDWYWTDGRHMIYLILQEQGRRPMRWEYWYILDFGWYATRWSFSDWNSCDSTREHCLIVSFNEQCHLKCLCWDLILYWVQIIRNFLRSDQRKLVIWWWRINKESDDLFPYLSHGHWDGGSVCPHDHRDGGDLAQHQGDISSILIGAYNRTFPCMEANYPYAIKNQRGARNTPSRGYFCDELVLYGIRLLA